MNGLILRGLKNVVVERHGADAWTEAHELAGREKRLYMPSTDYPSELVLALVDGVVEATGVQRSHLLTTLGRALVPDFVTVYGVHVRSEWTALELVAHLEAIVRGACDANRFTDFDAPCLRCEIVDERTVRIEYDSDSGLCSLLEGVLDGIGDHYDEPLRVDHRGCRDDASSCTFRVRRIGGPRSVSTGTTASAPKRAPTAAEEFRRA